MNPLFTIAADQIAPQSWYAMKLGDAVMILAVLVAPFLAVHVQRRLDAATAARGRREAIFKTLMATRDLRWTAEHVRALNLIDLEFHAGKGPGGREQSPKDRAVTDAWHVYLDSLMQDKATDQRSIDARSEKWHDMLVNLLAAMSVALDYEFDKVSLKRSVYSPEAQGNFLRQDVEIREGIARILRGDSELRVMGTLPPEALSRQLSIQQNLGEVLAGQRPITIKLAEAWTTEPGSGASISGPA